MYSVKIEFERKDAICRGCLSTNRQSILLKNETDLFYSLLGVQQQYCEARIILCWECVAYLKKIQTFQNRIQHAQFILQQSLYELDNLPMTPLSTLTISKKDGYDTIVDRDELKSIKDPEVDPEPYILPDIVKEEITEDDSNHNYGNNTYANDDNYSDNEIITIDLNKLKQLDAHIKVENTKKATLKSLQKDIIKKQSIRKYENKARVTTLDVDFSETTKHCTTVVLSEKEIEEILERDKAQYGYNKMPHKCKDCKNVYKRLVDLRRHETFNHMKSSPTKCTFCDAPVTSQEALQKHWLRHNGYFKCCACGWVSHSLASMTKHHRRVHTRLYHCEACEYTCSTLREFSIHYKETHERIICDHCGKSFIKKKTLEVHIKRHHAPAFCPECNRTYAHYHVLENHLRMQHPHLIRADARTELSYCVECDKQFPSVYKYRRHLATAAKHTPPKRVRVPCPECGKVFARKIRMTNHYKSVHINTTKHRCDICNKTFCSAFSARTHRQHVHEKIPLPKNKMCDICGRGFSTNRILMNHRRTHTGERPYKCAYCPATFAQRTAMKTHERTQHKRPDPP